MLTRDLMTTDLITVGETDTLATVYDLMDQHHVRHLPVIDPSGDLAGLLTQRDLGRDMLGKIGDLTVSDQRSVLKEISVSELMMREVETVAPTDPIVQSAELMLENKFGCVPVVDGDKLVGILTEADFVKHVITELSQK